MGQKQLIKNCVLLSFALHSISTCKAQPEQVERVYVFKSYQFIAGLNASYGYGDDFTMVKNHLQGKQLVKYGWRFGVGARHQFLKMIDSHIMLLLEQKGWKTSIDVTAFYPPLNQVSEATDVTLTYATLIFRPAYRLKAFSRLAIGMGVYCSSLIEGKAANVITFGSTILSTYTGYGRGNSRIFDFGLTPAISYEFFSKGGRMNWAIQLSNYFGLIDTTDPHIPTFSRYSNTYSISIINSF